MTVTKISFSQLESKNSLKRKDTAFLYDARIAEAKEKLKKEAVDLETLPGCQSMNKSQEITTLGGGCFWCLEAVFSELRGVENVVSGYSGGSVPNPSYQQVCTGATGNAEVVQITFDPDIISFKELLEIFLTIHDPTNSIDREQMWALNIVQ